MRTELNIYGRTGKKRKTVKSLEQKGKQRSLQISPSARTEGIQRCMMKSDGLSVIQGGYYEAKRVWT
jgi:hypothetical protein